MLVRSGYFLCLASIIFPQKAASITTTVSSIQTGLSFFLSPLFGSLSDTYGRRPFFIVRVLFYNDSQTTRAHNNQIGVVLSCLPGIALALLIWFNQTPLLYFCATIASGVISTSWVILAVVADWTDPSERTAKFGMVSSFGVFDKCAQFWAIGSGGICYCSRVCPYFVDIHVP